jgi:hypothetical protein
MVLFLGWVLGENFLHLYAKLYFQASDFVDLTIQLNRVLVLLLEPVDQPACLFLVDIHIDLLLWEVWNIRVENVQDLFTNASYTDAHC